MQTLFKWTTFGIFSKIICKCISIIALSIKKTNKDYFRIKGIVTCKTFWDLVEVEKLPRPSKDSIQLPLQ